jgi:uncharacterized protein (DUF1684 family)
MEYVQLVRIMLLAIGLALGTAQVVSGQDQYVQTLEHERRSKDRELASRKHSPLLAHDRKVFRGLQYFPIKAEWVKAAHFKHITHGDTMDIMTSNGKSKRFVAYGTLVFEHGDSTHSLIAYLRIWPEGYVSPYPPSLFVPFTDNSTGSSTYGGGRYMDIDIPAEDGRVTLDFNRCYNPYCAYGDGFSCPIPPRENDLSIAVEAGERNVADHPK